MGVLLNTRTGKSHALKPLHIVGRDARHADTVLAMADASLLHATIRWSNRQWVLCDHSRNGCFLNGKPLRKDVPVPLALKDEIRFGMLDGTPWKMVDVSAPGDLLVPVSPGLEVIKLENFLALPDEQAPQVCLYRTAVGTWVRDSGEDSAPLADGEVVQVGAKAWRLMCREEVLGTLDLMTSHSDTCLKFQISLDEEHVQLTVFNGLQEVDMGERAHHYLLLVLARQRLQDAERGLDPMAQGWIELDDLVRMLQMDRVHLNIQMFRLRKQFAEAIAEGLVQEDFIERRRGGVRLGHIGLEVRRGSTLEGTWRPTPFAAVPRPPLASPSAPSGPSSASSAPSPVPSTAPSPALPAPASAISQHDPRTPPPQNHARTDHTC